MNINANINTQQLRCFMELAKCLNFTRAAANLYVAQPTLSQHIAELEAQLGVTLFTRNSRSVTLTPAGAIMYAAMPNIGTLFLDMQHRMLVTAAGFSGSLTIGFLEIFQDFVPFIIRSFRDLFPDIEIRPFCAPPNELSQGLKNGTIDIALSATQNFSREDSPTLTTKRIMRSAKCLVLPEGQPNPSGNHLTEATPLIVWGESVIPGYYSHVKDCLKRLEIQVSKVIYADSLASLRAYLESGFGFSVLADKYANIFSESIQFIPIQDEYVEFGLLWNEDSSNPTLPLFLDFLEQLPDPTAEPDTTDSI